MQRPLPLRRMQCTLAIITTTPPATIRRKLMAIAMIISAGTRMEPCAIAKMILSQNLPSRRRARLRSIPYAE